MPSKGGLLARVLLAILAATVILTGFVLPAEYNIDPTGVGKAMGLTQLAAPKPEGIPVLPLAPPGTSQFYDKAWHTDEVKIKLKGDGELEYKFRMKTNDAIVYSWTADGKVYYDFHAESEPKAGEKRRDLRYKEEQETTLANGELTAPFDGIHGWYWLNLEGRPTTITVKVAGFYSLRSPDEQPTESQ